MDPIGRALARLLAPLLAPQVQARARTALRFAGRVLTGLLLALYLSLVCSFAAYRAAPSGEPRFVAADPEFHVDTASGRIRDRHARERIFHGVNVVFKEDPWLPPGEGFDSRTSFSDDDIRVLQQLGLNGVRLGVMWPGVHPQFRVVNHTYLGAVMGLIRRMHAARIHTLVDFHQDVFGERFCGEGVPGWLMDDEFAERSGDKPNRNEQQVNADSSSNSASSNGYVPNRNGPQPKGQVRGAKSPLLVGREDRRALEARINTDVTQRGHADQMPGDVRNHNELQPRARERSRSGAADSAGQSSYAGRTPSYEHDKRMTSEGYSPNTGGSKGPIPNEGLLPKRKSRGDRSPLSRRQRGQRRVCTSGDLACAGYARSINPADYAKSFPEPLQPRYSIGMQSEDARGARGPLDPLRMGRGESGSGERTGLQSSSVWERKGGLGPLRMGRAESHLGEPTGPQVKSKAKGEWRDDGRDGLEGKHLFESASRVGGPRYKVPGREDCLKMDWGLYHFSFAVSRAFQDLYENQWGWRDRLADFWHDVADALKDEEGIIGYDLMNEPWAGDVFSNPLLLAPGVADRLNYAPLYDHLQRAIREVDASRLIFFEGLTFDNAVSGFQSVPGGEGYANMSVISYHYYRPPNVAPKAAFIQREAERQRLNFGWMLTEFGIPNKHPDWLTRGGSSRRDVSNDVSDDVGGAWDQGLEKACLPLKEGSSEGGLGADLPGDEQSCGAKARNWTAFAEAWGVVAGLTNSSAHNSSDPRPDPGSGPGPSNRRLREKTWHKEAEYLRQRLPIEHKDSKEGSFQESERAQEILRSGQGVAGGRGGKGLKEAVPSSWEAEETRGPVASGAGIVGGRGGEKVKDAVAASKEVNETQENLTSGEGIVGGSWDEMVEVLQLADEHAQSWLAWEYKPFYPITGASYGFFEPGPKGGLHPLVVQFFWRTYPVAVAGSIQGFQFDPYNASFNLVYTAGSKLSISEGPQDLLGGEQAWLQLPAWLRLGLEWVYSPMIECWHTWKKQLHRNRGGRMSGKGALSSLWRTTEINVCCNRTMAIQVLPEGVAITWIGKGRVNLVHPPRLDGALISVHIQPA